MNRDVRNGRVAFSAGGHTGHARRASTYLLVLGTAMLVAATGLAALAAVRVHHQAGENAAHFARARLLAWAGLELALRQVGQGPNWRSQIAEELTQSIRTLDGGAIMAQATDPIDGDVANNRTDPLLLTGTGMYGSARYLLEVRLVAVPGPLAALNTCLHAGGNITVKAGRTVSLAGQPLSTNGTLHHQGAIEGSVHAAAKTGSGTITGPQVIPAPAKPLPDTSVIGTWAARARNAGVWQWIDRQVWGPGTTPGGHTHPEGIYLISGGGNDLVIRRSRMCGTFVLRCPGRKVRIENNAVFEPSRAGYPVLLVEGDLEIDFNSISAVLSESQEDVNFNPPGAESAGQYDFDTVDVYPAQIRGLVYTTGKIYFRTAARMIGTTLSEGSVDIDAQVQFQHDGAYYLDPPQGFIDPAASMAIERGSWRRTVLP